MALPELAASAVSELPIESHDLPSTAASRLALFLLCAANPGNCTTSGTTGIASSSEFTQFPEHPAPELLVNT